MTADFYLTFEEKYRGSRELIMSRLRAYLPFVSPLAELHKGAQTIDLGCGRGEWLELMTEIGFTPSGIDLNDDMHNACIALGLPAKKGDAIAFLSALPSESQAVASAFHFIEHISFEQLQTVVSEALRVLKPGGLLIMETPNPENIVVATSNFYLDPTHQRPIPHRLLAFLTEYYGFARTKIIRLQEPKDLMQSTSLKLHDVLSGVSPDYAVIAQKKAVAEVFHRVDSAFELEYGLSLVTLAARYDTLIEAKIEQAHAQQAEDKAQQADLQAQQQIQRLLDDAEQARALAAQSQRDADELSTKLSSVQRELLDTNQVNLTHWMKLEQTRKELHEVHQYNHHHWLLAEQQNQQLQALMNSRSWRITAPLREANAVLRSAIGRTLRLAVCQGKALARRLPAFKRAALWGLWRFPVLKRLVTRFSATPFSAARVQRAQIRHFEQLRSVRIMHTLSELPAHDTDGPVSFLKVSNDVS